MANIRTKVKQFLISGTFATPENYMRSKGAKIGKGCYISPCHFGTSEGYLVEIGNYCRIAKEVEFFTHGLLHSIKIKYNAPDLDYFGKIKIGDYVQIGVGVIILAGVTIGNNVIIGAGSVVSKSIPDGCMVAGNPIKFIGKTEDWYNKIKAIDLKSGQMGAEEKKKFLLSLPDSKFVHKPFIETDK